jgi:hypothetical protein
MDKKDLSLMLGLAAFMIFITGCIVGIALNLTGYTHISIASWRYWAGFSSLLIPVFTTITLRHFNISPTGIFGRLMLFYASCITAIVITTCILERSLEWWPTIVYITVFSILYPIVLFILEHPLVKSKVDAVKNKFSGK